MLAGLACAFEANGLSSILRQRCTVFSVGVRRSSSSSLVDGGPVRCTSGNTAKAVKAAPICSVVRTKQGFAFFPRVCLLSLSEHFCAKNFLSEVAWFGILWCKKMKIR